MIAGEQWFRRASLASCVLLMLLTACAKGQPVVAVEGTEAVLSPTLIGVVSVFMKITNSGDARDTLLGVRTDLPGTVAELHDIEDGRMVKVASIAVPKKGHIVLGPSRQHIMVYRLPRYMKAGDSLDLILAFKTSGERTVRCPVTAYNPLHK